MASVEDVQPVDTMWLSPRNPKRMEPSLASVPMVAVGMVYMLHWAFRSTAFAVPDGWKRKRWSVSQRVPCSLFQHLEQQLLHGVKRRFCLVIVAVRGNVCSDDINAKPKLTRSLLSLVTNNVNRAFNKASAPPTQRAMDWLLS